ncbi:MAG: MFS transporter [Chloroflexi bacterium]|nr:MFS transporter [Chloroflexota bacterium]
MANLIRQPSDEGVIHTAPDTVPCTREVGRWVLVATILGSSMAMIDGTAVNVALPVLQKSLNATVAEVQWIAEAYALFLAALILVGGSLGDLFGRRRIFAIGVALFAVASAGCGLSQNTTQLILTRAIQGIGGALMIPGSLAMISTTFSKEQRGQAIGTWSGFTVITGALGPVLGGWLVEHVSWRGVFFLNVPLAIIVLGILLWRVPENRDETLKGKPDWWGALLVTLGLSALVYGLITASDLSLSHPVVLGSLVVACIVLMAFLLREARSQTPMVPLSLFRSQTFSGANIFTLLLYAAFGGILFFFPFDLIQVQGYSATEAGAALLPLILITFLLSRWSGGLVNRYGAKLPLVLGPIIAALGLALYAWPTVGGSYWTTFFPAVVVQGLGVAITATPLTTTVMGAVESAHAGLASGINNAVARTAALLSVAVLSIVFLSVFAGSLNSHLAPLEITPEIRQQLAAQQTKLAGIQIPMTVSSQTRVALERAITESFVASFRTVVSIAVGLTLASALTAWLTIRGPGTVGREGEEQWGDDEKKDSSALEEGQAAQ